MNVEVGKLDCDHAPEDLGEESCVPLRQGRHEEMHY